MKDETRVTCMLGNFAAASADADVVMLDVPPGELKSLFSNEGLSQALRGKTIVSLLAGISGSKVQELLLESAGQDGDEKANVIWVMPTIGAQAGKSVSLIAEPQNVTKSQRDLCEWIFKQIGEVIYVPERLMNEGTAAGALCHSLSVIAVEAVTDSCVSQGLPRSVALALASKVLASAAGMMAGEMSPETLKEAMSIPHGITIGSFLQLEKGGVRSAISEACSHAIEYARDM